MITYTDQQLFDRALAGIRQQGGPAMLHHSDACHQCVYLADNGRRCAAGHLMNNPSSFITGNADEDGPKEELFQSGISPEQIPFVKELQQAHDDSAFKNKYFPNDFLKSFETNMKELAERHCLRYQTPEND